MTVSVTHATQGATVVTTKTSAVAVAGAPTHSYTSTRSAAMMALAMGQRPKSPASSSKSTGLANAPIKSLSSNNSNVIKSSTTTKAPSTAAVPVAIAHTNGILGPQSGGSGSSGSDNDGFNSSTSSTATALRRFYFKSGRSAKSKVNASATQSGKPLNAIGLNVGTAVTTTTTTTATYHEQHPIGVASHASVATTVAGVPKVVIMGSSTASMADTTINTSTESASTLVTSVTHTDTSETCDSLDLGDTSGQSEPLFSSLEEPLLTAIQIDSEHDGTELELTSCSMYSRPDMNLQDSTEPSLSLDSTVETLLIKNEGDFISVEQGKDLARKRNSQQMQHPPHHPAGSQQQQQQLKRDENMRQLLDVTNTLTFEELRDFEMRYGSPHHSRSQSVKMPGSRASGRPNQLCLPQQRSRVASMPNTGVEEEYYRLRHFSITGKGVVNRGDSLKSRRSRSNNSVASSNSSTEHLTTTQIPAPNSARTSATCSLASSRESSTSNPGSGPYRVLMLGGPAVGKSSLVSQFMTSEYLHAYDTSIDDDSGEKAVSVLLNGEESELIFIDHSYTEMAPDDCLGSYDPHGYCVIYSASDRSSFTLAEHVLQVLWTNQNIAQKAVILVGNKADLARSRSVTTEEGKAMATAYDCKFIEASVGINHNVDELLVGLLSQIRLKLENPEKSRDLFRKRSIRKSKRRACSPLGSACLSGGATNPNTPLGPVNNVITDVNTPPSSAHSSPRKYRGSRTSTSLKVKGLLGRVWARDSKSKSCENLHVL